METREEKIGPVAILETKEGLRVAVYVVREFVTAQFNNGAFCTRLTKAEYKTDGGQSVIPEYSGDIANIYGSREPILCNVVSGNIRPEGCELLAKL